MELETRRLVLRKLTVADAPFVLAVLNQPDWLRFVGDRAVHTIGDAEEYIRTRQLPVYETSPGLGPCGVVVKGGDDGRKDDRAHPTVRSLTPCACSGTHTGPMYVYFCVPHVAGVVGMVGLLKREYLSEPDLGFAFLTSAQGRGYAEEACRAVLTATPTMLPHVSTLAAMVLPENVRCVNLLTKLGFAFTRTQRLDDGEDIAIYTAAVH